MFWLIKKIFWLGILVAIVYYGSQYKIDGKPIKDYAREFYEAPFTQALIKTGTDAVQDLVKDNLPESKDVPAAAETADEAISGQDQKVLENVLEKVE